MNKFSVILISALSAMTLLAGCSKNEKPENKPEGSVSSAENVTEAAASTITTETPTEAVVRDIEKAEGTYVYDYAKILNGEAFEECNNYAEWLYEKHLINTAVVTTDSLDGLTPEQYAENAYVELYGGRGSGLLILINNDTNEDFIYKKGSCLTSISQETQDNEMYRATQEIVAGDYKSGILRLMKLGEECPGHIFDNGGIFNAEELASLEKLCEGTEISVLATSNGTGTPNDEICKSYYDRRYQDGNGFMIMLDTTSDTLTAVSGGALPAGFDVKINEANELAAVKNYSSAVSGLVNALKG